MFNLKFQFDLTIKVTPTTATLKLNGESRQLINGQYTEKVDQGTRLKIEVDHPAPTDYEKQEHTIQMGEEDMVKEYELVSCKKLKNCKPNWSEWGRWGGCKPYCYNDYSKRRSSTKERRRYYLPDRHYWQKDWKYGEAKQSRQCSHVLPRCPYDKLKAIVVKNSDKSYNTNDYFFARVINGNYEYCTVNLDTNWNDFQYGNLDTFTDLNHKLDGTYFGGGYGKCQDFNITQVTEFKMLKMWIERAWDGHGYEGWLSDYVLLKSDNPRVKYKCTNHDWITKEQDEEWVSFDCRRY